MHRDFFLHAIIKRKRSLLSQKEEILRSFSYNPYLVCHIRRFCLYVDNVPTFNFPTEIALLEKVFRFQTRTLFVLLSQLEMYCLKSIYYVFESNFVNSDFIVMNWSFVVMEAASCSASVCGRICDESTLLVTTFCTNRYWFSCVNCVSSPRSQGHIFGAYWKRQNYTGTAKKHSHSYAHTHIRCEKEKV